MAKASKIKVGQTQKQVLALLGEPDQRSEPWYTAPDHSIRGDAFVYMPTDCSPAERGWELTVEFVWSRESDGGVGGVYWGPAQNPCQTALVGHVKEMALDLGNSVTMKLVPIPAGDFRMGSPVSEAGRRPDEGPQHRVTISRPFYMGTYPVTQQQYQQVMGKNPSPYKGAQRPVMGISWDEAREFCQRLSQQTGRKVRLPTEAEWEYACRAGSRTPFSYGDDRDGAHLGDYAWYLANNPTARPQPVGLKKPNAWGLYDMHGNIRQWCSDWYWKTYPDGSAVDPTGPETGTARVLRGGTWGTTPLGCRSAVRQALPPNSRSAVTGFRIVQDME